MLSVCIIAIKMSDSLAVRQVIPARGEMWGIIASSQSLRKRTRMTGRKFGKYYGFDFSPMNSLLPEDGVKHRFAPLHSQLQTDEPLEIAAAARKLAAGPEADGDDAPNALLSYPKFFTEDDDAVVDGLTYLDDVR